MTGAVGGRGGAGGGRRGGGPRRRIASSSSRSTELGQMTAMGPRIRGRIHGTRRGTMPGNRLGRFGASGEGRGRLGRPGGLFGFAGALRGLRRGIGRRRGCAAPQMVERMPPQTDDGGSADG